MMHLLLCTLTFLALLELTHSIRITPSFTRASQIQRSTSRREGDAFSSIVAWSSPDGRPMVEVIKEGVGQNINLFKRGLTGVWANYKRSNKIKKMRKQKGEQALSFTDYKFLEQAGEDTSKFFRLAVTFPFSPEYFFYSYVVFPMMSSDNPYAWKSMPSTFDDPEYKTRRTNGLIKRRIQAFVFSMVKLQDDVADDVSTQLRKKRIESINLIETALKQKTLDASLTVLQPWLIVSKKAAKKQKNKKQDYLTLDNVPGAILKEWCKAIGVDGVPNLPLINRLNRGEMNRYIDKVKLSDEFLVRKGGVDTLSDSEVHVACFERCISVSHNSAERRSKDLRNDLDQWLDNIDPAQPASVRRVRINSHNKRFAMMALNIAKDLKVSHHADIYRTLLG